MSSGQPLSPIPEPSTELPEGGVERTSSCNSSIADAEWDAAGRSLVDGMQPERALEEGSCVCFFTSRGQLMVARPVGRFWELHPIAVGETSYDADGNQRLLFHPPEAIFTVMKKGRLVGFRSLIAEGRTLQAVARDDAPHRVNNHNFGDWESWEPTPEGLMNVRFKNKKLGLEIREVRAVAVQDLKGAQRSHLRSIRQMQKKVHSADSRITEAERRVKEALRSSQRQAALHQKELTHVRGRLEETLKSQQKREVETMQTGAAFKQVELRFSKLMAEKDALEAAASQEKHRFEGVQRDMQLIRERHDGEMHRLELAHSSEMNALTREKELELKHAKQHYEDQLRRLRSELGSKAMKKDNRITELEGHLGGTVKEKDQQITDLVDECNRLRSALKAIKSQVEQAHMAKASLEAGNMSLSPILSPTMLRTSPGVRSLSRGASRSPSHRSGRSSADPVLCINPAASPIAIGPASFANALIQQERGSPLDRSGARAPTPSNDVFPPKDMSPKSTHSDVNPPAASDNDHSEELTLPLQESSLSLSFPQTCELDTQRALRQNSSFVLRRSNTRESDGDESDSYESAIEEVEGLEGGQRLTRSGSSASSAISDLQKDGQGMVRKQRAGKVAEALRSFPIDNEES